MQNIIFFIGLVCQRHLFLYRSYSPKPPNISILQICKSSSLYNHHTNFHIRIPQIYISYKFVCTLTHMHYIFVTRPTNLYICIVQICICYKFVCPPICIMSVSHICIPIHADVSTYTAHALCCMPRYLDSWILIYVCTYVYMYTYNICICVYIYTYIYACVCIYTYLCICACVYIYICMCVYINIHVIYQRSMWLARLTCCMPK